MKKAYLDTKIKELMENLIFQTLCEQPENPALFMIKILQKAGGYNATNLTQAEKDELELLRKEVEKYRKDNKYTYKTLTDENASRVEEEKKSVAGDEDKKETKSNRQNRKAISAEAYGEFNEKQEYHPDVMSKTDNVFYKIKNALLLSFLFNGLENRDLINLINSMEEYNARPGETIYRQGDKGNNLYVIYKGELNCFKKLPNEVKETLVKTYLEGEIFGEVSVLYNAPRESTIRAKTESTLFKLSREAYSNIISDLAQEKRQRYYNIIRKVDVFSILTESELYGLCLALKRLDFRPGDYVTRLGEVQNSCFIIEEGESVSFAKKRGDKEMKHSHGECLGQVSLLKDIPRNFNLLATSELKILTLDRDSVNRIVGNLAERVKKNEELNKIYFGKN